jgi:hypothetical protein
MCPHRLLMFWGSHSQANGVSCRRCGQAWVRRRRYIRTKRGRVTTITRLVLSPSHDLAPMAPK